ncbi:MAG: fumarate hydratase C-terminal domain-containing protein [Armatimonadota bacterium]
MAEHRLTPPLTETDVRALRVGDWVTLNGIIFGVRDATLIRIFDHGQQPPVDLRGAVLLHTAPNVRKVGDRYEPLSVGTTTSTRMDRFTAPLLRTYDVRAIIGKAGLLDGSVRAMAEHGAAYFTIVGGAAAWQTLHIEAIEAVYWEDLMPECLWQFRVRDLGPLLVSIDSYGESTYARVKQDARQRLAGLLEKSSSESPPGNPPDRGDKPHGA